MWRARFGSRIIVSAHGLKNELDPCVACSFRLMDYCFGTLIKDRFMCGVHVWRSCFGSRIIVSNSAH